MLCSLAVNQNVNILIFWLLLSSQNTMIFKYFISIMMNEGIPLHHARHWNRMFQPIRRMGVPQ